MDEKFDTLIAVNKYIVNLVVGIEKAVEYFQAGDDKKGCELILPISEGIQWMSDALSVTKDIHKQDMKLVEMNGRLGQVVVALENRDFILIGDLLQYELIPIIESIQKNINSVLAN